MPAPVAPPTIAQSLSGSVPGKVDTKVELLDMLHKDIIAISTKFPDYKSASITNGPYRPFDSEAFNSAMLDVRKYCGVANSIFALDLDAFAPIGYLPTMDEVVYHGGKYYDIRNNWDPKTKHHTLNARTTLFIPVNSVADPQKDSQFKGLRRLSGDKDVLAAAHELANAVRRANCVAKDAQDHEPAQEQLQRMYEFVRHWPMDYRVGIPAIAMVFCGFLRGTPR